MNRNDGKVWLKWLLIVCAVILCNLFVVRLAFVYGRSMEPTLEQGDWVLVWKLGYTMQVGDIVVTDAENPLGQSLIKRVVATEGQQVCIHAGEVYVDDWLATTIDAEDESEEVKLMVPAGHVFLMGDNSSASTDSRTIGCIPVKNIMGKVIARVFPFDGITLNFSKKH